MPELGRLNLPGEPIPELPKRGWMAKSYRFRPGIPRHPLKISLQCRKEGELLQPVGILITEICKRPVCLPGGIGEEGHPGGIKQLPLQVNYPGEVNPARRQFPDGGELLPGDQPLFSQFRRTDQKAIPGKGGGTGVGRIFIPGRIQRKNLPQLLSRRFQKIHESVGPLPHVSNSIGRWEGSNMQ